MKRPRGPMPNYSPRAASRTLISDAASVLDANPTAISVRSLNYQLVGLRDGYEKTSLAFERNGEIFAKARRAGMLDFDAIYDQNLTEHVPLTFASVEEFEQYALSLAEQIQYPLLAAQDLDVMVWTEARGMLPVVRRVCDPLTIPVWSTGGFDSVTAKHRVVRDRFDAGVGDRPLHILHLGDRDLAGENLFTALMEDVEAWAEHYGCEVWVHRLGLTEEQALAWGIPDDPSHPGNYQMEAVPFEKVKGMLNAAFRQLLDTDLLDESLAQRDILRENLVARLTR